MPSVRAIAIPAAGLLIAAGATLLVVKGLPRSSGSGAAQADPCGLLTDAEIEAVQGEPARERKASRASGGALTTSQCYFALPTSSKSISLLVAERGTGPGARDPKDDWRKAFSAEAQERREESREREGEEHERPPLAPAPVPGLGDEAFWLAAATGGALHVLVGGRSFRISLGGTGTPAEKKDRAVRLARPIVARLKAP